MPTTHSTLLTVSIELNSLGIAEPKTTIGENGREQLAEHITAKLIVNVIDDIKHRARCITVTEESEQQTTGREIVVRGTSVFV